MMQTYFNAVRVLNGIKKPLSVQEALKIAKLECERHDLAWVEPVSVIEGSLRFDIKTNANYIGNNAYISVSIKDGTILRFGYSPR
jgi:hypothetical protein